MIFTMILIDECHHDMNHQATTDPNEEPIVEMIVDIINLKIHFKFVQLFI